MTAVSPPGRFGAIELDGDRVGGFTEKPKGDGGMINGGFFVLSPSVFDYIEGVLRFGNSPQWKASLQMGNWLLTNILGFGSPAVGPARLS